ncbi:MAG: hypothetical protein NVSMB17_08660 [Candidatus Dormibacteria bacterium]
MVGSERVGQAVRRPLAVLLLATLVALVSVLAAPVASRAAGSGSLTPQPSGSTTQTWTGTVAPGAGNAPGAVALRCTAGNPTSDIYSLTINDPGGAYYKTHQAVLTIRIDWTPTTPGGYATSDLGLTVMDTVPGSLAEYFDSHQQGTKFETISITNPHFGVVYSIGACADANGASQPFTGTAVLNSTILGAAGGPIFDTGSVINFSAATIVSPTFLGGEPQATIERPQANSVAGAINPDRVFIDWPLSTRTQTGQLYRSNDHGRTFNNLVDLTCAPRNRPTCATGGGGDTVNRVNFYDGTVIFGDQEGVSNEALATSVDHGDSFPATRQFAISNPDTGVDRQWIAPVNAPGLIEANSGQELRGFYSYHIPAAGQYIQGIDTAGRPIPQPAPQILSVSQSGPSRVDTTGGPGNNYIYQGFRDGTGFRVGVSPIAGYVNPTSWKVGTVSTDSPTIFPWINLDSHGNLYAAWVTGGKVYYSYSLIDDDQNNPAKGGTPATKWAPRMNVNLPGLASTVFPEIVAGDPGRVAISYMGTADGPAGISDNSPANANWNVYVAYLTGALTSTPVVATGRVNHRVAHTGSICTSGTTCTGDRSLLDMIDLQFDKDGYVGVVFTDNNSTFATTSGSATQKGSPFVHYARQVQGPSLLDAGVPINQLQPNNDVSAPAGDARWPNTASGAKLPALDLTGSSLSLDATGKLVATLKLADATVAGMQRDLAAYNSVPQANAPATRLQYVLRFSTDTDILYLGFDIDAAGTMRYYGGRLDGLGDQITLGPSIYGATYPAKALYSGTLAGDRITITAPAKDFGLTTGSPLYSVQAFSAAGPSDGSDTTLANPMRQVDAVAPFDTVLGAPSNTIPEVPAVAGLGVIGLLVVAVAALRRRRILTVKQP